MRCDVVAQGVVEAAKAIQLKVPVVVRLEGTNVDKGQEILAQLGASPGRCQGHEGRGGESRGIGKGWVGWV